MVAMNGICLEHVSEDLLELYLIRQVSESEAEVLEAHLLVCDSCRGRLDKLEDDRSVMRKGFALLASEEWQLDAAIARASELWSLRYGASGPAQATEPEAPGRPQDVTGVSR
jgi:hypothetical protein